MKSFNKKSRQPRKLKETLLRSFLIISIICCVFLVSNCDQLFDLFGPGNGGGTTNPPGLGGSEESGYSAIFDLFASVADGAEGQIGSQATGWILSSVGISNGSPDYTAELNKIEGVLETISGQLNNIETELISIDNDLKRLDCDSWIQTYTTGTTEIKNRMSEYTGYINDVKSGALVPDSTINQWVGRVLNGYGNTSDILTYLGNMENSLLDAGGSGTIYSCFGTLTLPDDHTFNTDTLYYHQVHSLINYFYLLQVEALYVYTEARHYQALKTYQKNVTTPVSADSVSIVCQNEGVAYICNDIASQTNNLYNNLIAQFTAAGAPFSDDSLIAEWRGTTTSGPYLWARSLEDFTQLAFNQGVQSVNCSSPLTSSAPCGVMANFYNQGSDNIGKVVYDGYSKWEKAGTALLSQLMYGWYTGTAGDFLEQRYDFKNMKNKVIMSQDMETISLNESGANQNVVPFIDTDFDYNWFSNVPGEPVIQSFPFQAGLLTKTRPNKGFCSYDDGKAYSTYYDIHYFTNSNMKVYNRNEFYDAYAAGGHCDGDPTYDDPVKFTTWPGWLASQDGTPNTNASAIQYQWPVLPTDRIPCTNKRSRFNITGVWTICGDDFTQFLKNNVQRPATCSNTVAANQCIPPL